MYESLYEDLTLAKMADYDRIVRRLHLEREALAAACEAAETGELRPRRLLRPFSWRRSPSLR